MELFLSFPHGKKGPGTEIVFCYFPRHIGRELIGSGAHVLKFLKRQAEGLEDPAKHSYSEHLRNSQ